MAGVVEGAAGDGDGRPSRDSARCIISRAALLVNVRSRIAPGGTPDSTSRATRYVSVRVLPLPAPAMTRAALSGGHDRELLRLSSPS